MGIARSESDGRGGVFRKAVPKGGKRKGLIFTGWKIGKDSDQRFMKKVTQKLRKFAQARNWDQFHSPKSLACSISIESAELLELFQWSQGQGWGELKKGRLKIRTEEELADILLYLLRFADMAGIDLLRAAHRKIRKNALKYPIKKSYGTDKKYTEL